MNLSHSWIDVPSAEVSHKHLEPTKIILRKPVFIRRGAACHVHYVALRLESQSRSWSDPDFLSIKRHTGTIDVERQYDFCRRRVEAQYNLDSTVRMLSWIPYYQFGSSGWQGKGRTDDRDRVLCSDANRGHGRSVLHGLNYINNFCLSL